MKDNIKEILSAILGIVIFVGACWFIGDLISNKEESADTIIEVCGTEISTSEFVGNNHEIDGKNLGKTIEEYCEILYSESLRESYFECEESFGADYDTFKDCMHDKTTEKLDKIR